MSGFTLNYNLKAVLAYEHKLIIDNLKIEKNKKNELTLISSKESDHFSRAISLYLIENFKVPVFSLNRFYENKNNLPEIIPSLVFNYESLSDVIVFFKENIKSEIHIGNLKSSDQGKRKLAVKFEKNYVLLNDFYKSKCENEHSFFDEMLKSKDGIILRVSENKDIYIVSINTKNVSVSYGIKKSGNIYFDLGLAVGKIMTNLSLYIK